MSLFPFVGEAQKLRHGKLCPCESHVAKHVRTNQTILKTFFCWLSMFRHVDGMPFFFRIFCGFTSWLPILSATGKLLPAEQHTLAGRVHL